MIDHIGIAVADFDRSIAFYEKALAPIGYGVLKKFGPVAGLGAGGHATLWIAGTGAPKDQVHVALRAKSRSEVKAFYDAAIAAGGKDNGPPGVRAHYHPDYYAAFVLDPDGHNLEVVCHEPYLG